MSNTSTPLNLICPLDGDPLSHHDRQWVCSNGHSFDIARQGYVNLLPVQHKRSKDPGDSKEMVAARTAFLDLAHYLPISQRLNEVIVDAYSQVAKLSVLDAGCGEGYYLDRLCRSLQQADKWSQIDAIGLDVSKWAIMAATKRNRHIQWVVGTNRQPPISENSVDLIICQFGFPCYDSFRHILKPGGRVLLVEAGPEHLIELRRVIYPTVKQGLVKDLCEEAGPGFSLESTTTLKYALTALRGPQISSLLAMTPHFYRVTREGREAAALLDKIDLTIDVTYNLLIQDGHSV